MPETLERIPPHNDQAEQSVLGSLLIDEKAMDSVADVLQPDDFYPNVHGMIYEAMLDLYQDRTPIDIVSVSNRLEEKKQLQTIGGRSYLGEIANVVPTASNADHYATIVHKASTLRRLIRASTHIADMAYTKQDEPIQDILDKVEQKIFGISQKFLRQKFIPIGRILDEAFERIDELHKERGKLRGVSTGFRDLDNLLSGFQKSDLIIIAARPSVGKTSFALNIARHTAVENGLTVGVFNLEMSKEQMVDRLLATEARIDMWRMRTGNISDADDPDAFPRIGEAMGRLSEAKIFIDDTATANVMEVRAKCRRLHAEHGLDLVILDYLQLMEGNNRENRVQEIAEITRGFKSIARELNIPFVTLSQLSRSVESRSPSIPKLSDLRESGSIEQDADVVLFLYRKVMDKTVRECPENEKHTTEVHVSKHRNGPTGVIKLYFDETQVSFKDLARR